MQDEEVAVVAEKLDELAGMYWLASSKAAKQQLQHHGHIPNNYTSQWAKMGRFHW